ncbi:hypothetical protein EV356DRAFT_438263 [Viridothelium virens]|uniref:Dicer-like protein 1 n=1 Tax=Viridothelium virens TaxID=1048519 RepID=A0A6A6HQ63_VIRVR|nr:hypothetical protein EV356DRAFT_438263 [Viridothelium virens]
MSAQLLDVQKQIPKHDLDDDHDIFDQDYENDDSASDEKYEGSKSPLTGAALKRKQRARFDSWIEETAVEIVKEQMRQMSEARPNEILTTKALVADQASQLIVNSPREYQLELFERAKKQNTIAVLDTGSGKTLIAVLLLKHVIEQELERRLAGQTPKISVFLVNSVTLVFQQAAVLERNLDYEIAYLYGSMGVSTRDKELWRTIRNDNMVLVCTAEILVQCLGHSFITIDQINLLIFDEAHHTKKDHPYARLIKDFYAPQRDKAKRPRIFAMTASPIDAKGDLLKIACDLEDYLDSRIATVSDLAMVQKCISRPKEEIACYETLRPPFEAPLHQIIQSRFGNLGVLEKLLRSSKIIASELGPWCSDAWWTSVLKEERLERLERRNEHLQGRRRGHSLPYPISPESIAGIDQKIRQLEEAARVAEAYYLRVPQYEHSDDLSTKVRQMIIWTRLHYEHATNARCIVFVERRDTARLLEKIFKYPHISGPHLRTASFIGSRSLPSEDERASTRQQVLTMDKFRKGDINLLFATSIAEEGLDIPDCNLVVRFDLYKTMIAYMQSRGRARHRNSKYLHMIENNNREHVEMVRFVRTAEEKMRQFCRSLPADRIMDESEEDSKRRLNDLSRQKIYEHPESKARLSYKSSLVILAHFVSTLPHAAETTAEPVYIPFGYSQQYCYEVVLPGSSLIPSVMGNIERSKILAKCSAAFNACLKLLEGGQLDSNFLPTHQKQLPAMRNARLAITSKKGNMYEMMIKPKIWEVDRGTSPGELFLTVLDLPQGCERPHCPIGLLTRTRMPDFPAFPLFLLAGRQSLLQTTNITTSLSITSEQLTQVGKYTHTVYLDVFGKQFEAGPQDMSYWFAPLKIEPETIHSAVDPSSIIDWDALQYVSCDTEFEWDEHWTENSLINRFFWDPYDGGKRYFTSGIDNSLSMNSPVPDEVDNAGGKKKTIKDFTVSLWTKSLRKYEEIKPYDVKQPVLRAERMMERRNLLDAPANHQKESRATAYIIPQPLKRSSLSTRAVAMILTIPCIIHRLESYLIALEACQLLGISIPPGLALEALTKDSDNTDEHEEMQIRFQRGMGKNYERLEFLGDCFLKMATSIAVYTQNPDNDEFEFHVKRMLLICNQTLFERARDLQITRYVRSQPFSRRLWYQEGLKLIRGKKLGKEGEKHEHSLGDKTVADICEALIGAAFLAHNKQNSWSPESWRNAVHAVTTFVSSEEHSQHKWDDYLAGYIRPKWDGRNFSAAQLHLAEKVEREHPYHFHSPKILQVAFKHPSYPRAWLDLPSYQRLEFLGDSLLDMACVTHLFYRYPTKDEQWLTEHKMAMVSNRFLGALCIKLGFYKHLLAHHDAIKAQVSDYETDVMEAEKLGNGTKDYWTAIKSPPKCLPDIVEAYVGAIFVDSEFDYNQVQRFFDMHIKPFFEDMTIYDSFANDHPTVRLHHLLDNLGCTRYRLMAKDTPYDETRTSTCIAAVMIHENIIGKGTAASGKNAKVKASKDALTKIEGLARFEFRHKFKCDCSQTSAAKLGRGDVGGGQDTAV